VPVRHRSRDLRPRHDCRAHELDNLYVVDTSIFPSISAVNPALTAMANSLRVGDHLLERLQ
jgi:choline dehydrogenase-like flavoprotein